MVILLGWRDCGNVVQDGDLGFVLVSYKSHDLTDLLTEHFELSSLEVLLSLNGVLQDGNSVEKDILGGNLEE